MEDSNPEAKACLKQWVKLQHCDQKIKGSETPYFSHLLAVAEMAGSVAALGFEIGLCHDLLEDTGATPKSLGIALSECGYNDRKRAHITACVVELTDEFTKSKYPGLRKKVRKEREAQRLLTISADAQTVKYGDLIYNATWTLQYDKQHARKYLLKKRKLLIALDRGNSDLRQKALLVVKEGLAQLS